MSEPVPSATPFSEHARIVTAARALYLHRGIDAVSMADVALYLRLPEPTVWQCFLTKAELVAAVVETHVAAVQTEMHRLLADCTTAVEELLALRNWASEELRHDPLPFFRELAAGYPASRQRWQQHMAHFPVVALRDNLQRGIGQGLYHTHLDVEACVERWFEQMRVMAATATEQPAADTHRALLNAFLADLVTPAGALVARRLQEAAPYY